MITINSQLWHFSCIYNPMDLHVYTFDHYRCIDGCGCICKFYIIISSDIPYVSYFINIEQLISIQFFFFLMYKEIFNEERRVNCFLCIWKTFYTTHVYREMNMVGAKPSLFSSSIMKYKQLFFHWLIRLILGSKQLFLYWLIRLIIGRF